MKSNDCPILIDRKLAELSTKNSITNFINTDCMIKHRKKKSDYNVVHVILDKDLTLSITLISNLRVDVRKNQRQKEGIRQFGWFSHILFSFSRWLSLCFFSKTNCTMRISVKSCTNGVKISPIDGPLFRNTSNDTDIHS